MKKYTASMTYTAEENLRADRVLDMTFGLTRTAILVLVGLAMAFYGALLKRGLVGSLTLVLGLFLVAMPFLHARQRGKKISAALGDRSQTVTYEFLPEQYRFSANGETVTGKYSSLFRLMEDERYLYLCLDRSRLMMVDKKSVDPEGADALKAFLTEQTRLPWYAPGFMLPGKEAVLPRR